MFLQIIYLVYMYKQDLQEITSNGWYANQTKPSFSYG